MEHIDKKLSEWSEMVMRNHFPNWKELPEIDLYIDQVVSLLGKNLIIFLGEKDDDILTPAMVNNYVKQNALPRPVKKRYSREHLAYLFMICVLKQVLSINEIMDLLSISTSSHSIDIIYDYFCNELEDAFKKVCASTENSPSLITIDHSNSPYPILQTAIYSSAFKSYVKNIIQIQQKNKQLKKHTEDKEKDKDKPKEKDKGKEKE